MAGKATTSNVTITAAGPDIIDEIGAVADTVAAGLTGTKPATQSQTLLGGKLGAAAGALAMLLPVLLGAFGFTAAQDFAIAGGLTGIVAMIGSYHTIVGRFRATKTLT